MWSQRSFIQHILIHLLHILDEFSDMRNEAQQDSVNWLMLSTDDINGDNIHIIIHISMSLP